MAELHILYEDSAVIIPEKPQNLSSEIMPLEKDSLPRRLLEYLSAREAGGEVYPVHRLDRVTGGAIVYAKTARAAATLSEAISGREIEKIYHAVVEGAPIEDEGEMTDLLYHDKRQNKVFVVKTKRKGAKEARLSFTVLERIASENGTLSLLRIRLGTGRTHQIRAQLSSRGMPIYGDRRYGSRRGMTGGRIALWSTRLSFPHPTQNMRIAVESSPPMEEPWRLFAAINNK